MVCQIRGNRGPPEQKEKYDADEVIQIPAVRGRSTNHKANVLDLIKQMYPKSTTLPDIGITKAREAKILQSIAESYSVPQINPDKDATRKRLEAFVHETRTSETVAKTIVQVQQRQKEDSKPMYRQITETLEPTPESIWEEVDILEGDPAHRGMVMRNARFKPFFLTSEASEWEGLWDKGVFKKWKRSDLLKNDRVFTSRYVYKIKRSAKTGTAYLFKVSSFIRKSLVAKSLVNIKPWMPSSRAKGSTLSDLRNLCGKGLTVGNMLKTSKCQLTWMSDLLHVNQRTL